MKKYVMLALLTLIFVCCSEDKVGGIEKGTLKGVVVNEKDNTPLEGVEVSSNPKSSIVLTNDRGEFVIEDILANEYSIEAKSEGFLTSFESVTIAPNNITEIVVKLSASTLINQPPSSPVLVAPQNGIRVSLNSEIILQWESVDKEEDELTFSVTLLNDKTDDVLTFSNISESEISINNLLMNAKYFWQVTASDGVNDDKRSEQGVFFTPRLPQTRIVYVTEKEGGRIINGFDDTNSFRLTNDNENSFSPIKNSVNQSVAFLRNVGLETHVFVMDFDGTNQKQVTKDIPPSSFNTKSIGISWTQNGQSILYPNRNKLISINPLNSKETLVYEDELDRVITKVVYNDLTKKTIIVTVGLNGFNSKIILLDQNGSFERILREDIKGVVGSVDFSIDGLKFLYTNDIDGFEADSRRQLNAHMLIYNLENDTEEDLSANKPDGFNDLNASFSPNNADVIFVNTSNDGESQKNILVQNIASGNREILIENGEMPSWE